MIRRSILFEILIIKQVSLNFDVRIDKFRIFCNSGSGVYCMSDPLRSPYPQTSNSLSSSRSGWSVDIHKFIQNKQDPKRIR